MKVQHLLLPVLMVASTLSTHASAEQGNPMISVEWLKNGRTMVHTVSYVRSPLDDKFAPSAFKSGNEIGYATCTRTDTTQKLTSNTQFVGQTLFVQPVSMDDHSVKVLITAIDTVSPGVQEVGPDDCRSQVVPVSGLVDSNVPATLEIGKTTLVPLSDPQYSLRMTVKSD